MEAPEKRAVGIALDFPVDDGADPSSWSWPPRIPRRLRRRLLEDYNKSPSTAEDIEARLRDADLRRQQFYERLSSKARPKQRSPSRSSSSDEDLGQRLEAKLMAAEQKRLSILADAQMRLAKLDELRHAAKTGRELRLEKEREKLGTKVETRYRQAQLNRMLLLRARKLRRTVLKERSSQMLLRRMARESNYKEHVHTLINQKRAAAEKKRLKLLEAERKRASARVLQVLRVVNSVSSQREVERKRIQDQLEDRLQRAKRQRAEYLRQRGRHRSSSHLNRRMLNQADLLSRKLARCWRYFQKTKRTTFDLAKSYELLGINEKSVMVMPFEQLAILIESSDTLLTVKALVDRIESRLRASQASAGTKRAPNLGNIDHLLKRVATPRKANRRTPVRSKEPKSGGPSRAAAKAPVRLSRYPVRIVLCAYMILGHPDAVLSGQGEREIALAMSAKEFVRELELLIRIILDGTVQSSDEESDTAMPKRCTFGSQLAVLDKAWCAYLNNFVVWKVKDAKLLEDDLVKAACQLELSMIQTCKLTAGGRDSDSLTHDMKAILKQVTEDQKLLREKVRHLSGDAGLERMETALSKTRLKYFQEKDDGSPVGSPIANLSSPSFVSSADPPAGRSVSGSAEKPGRVVRSLFKEDVSPLPNEFGSLSLNADSQVASADSLITENEVIVNGFLHDPHFTLAEDSSISGGRDSSIKEKVRQTMEKAFWDGVLESMEGEEPQYDRVIELMKEVRDELYNISPESWKEEISEAIDVDLLSQVLKSGNLDDDYLARILNFTLVTLRKLSSPASEDKLRNRHEQLLRELCEISGATDASKNAHAVAMTRGLRFALEEIQALKLEVSKARIQFIIPMLKGEAGFDYLRNAFANRCGPPSDAMRRLPLTVEWLSSLKSGIDQEWNEHTSSLSSVIGQQSASHGSIPSNIRTGGIFVVNSKSSQTSADTPPKYTGNQLEECKGERVDLVTRIGLLKLVCRVSALTHDTVPETFTLNLNRLRSIQAQMQKIVVISTSILICRQILLSERVVTSASDMEGILSGCIQSLVELLDRLEDVGIEEIVEVLSNFPRNGEVVEPDNRQSRQLIMARMLAKSLQTGDPVFERVSHSIYLAARAVVLGGSTPASKKLAETVLQAIGAVILTDRVAGAAEAVAVAAAVSSQVHEPWYKHIIDSAL